jgi:sec-independent protein translocase protein TatC
MIATQIASPFLTPFKLALVAAVFLAMPYILFQVWGFVAPGLYQHEKRFALPLLASSIVLFYLGMVFAYVVVFPLVFAFFAATTPDGVAQMPDISFYLDFVLKIFFAFGVAFQIPIATILLVAMGLTTAESLIEKRPYVIVGCFVVGMLLTPPDVISQTLLAVPMWMLYEAGIFFSRFFRKEEAEDASTDGDDPGRVGPGPTGGRPSAAPGARVTNPNPAPPPAGAAAAAPVGGVAAAGTEVASASLEPSSAAADTQARGSAPSEVIIGADIDGGDPFDRNRFVPMTPAEMEAELDAIEAAEAAMESTGGTPTAEDQSATRNAVDPIDALIERVKELRELENEAGARQLLYRVLADGNDSQRFVAMNILTEMDQP